MLSVSLSWRNSHDFYLLVLLFASIPVIHPALCLVVHMGYLWTRETLYVVSSGTYGISMGPGRPCTLYLVVHMGYLWDQGDLVRCI